MFHSLCLEWRCDFVVVVFFINILGLYKISIGVSFIARKFPFWPKMTLIFSILWVPVPFQRTVSVYCAIQCNVVFGPVATQTVKQYHNIENSGEKIFLFISITTWNLHCDCVRKSCIYERSVSQWESRWIMYKTSTGGWGKFFRVIYGFLYQPVQPMKCLLIYLKYYNVLFIII